MDNNTLLLIINIIVSTIIPVCSNLIQTIIQLCLKRIRKSSCLGGSIETYDPEKSKKEIKSNIV